jgi:23S rRNA (guanosine2251-2'-O)-methyltransferase
MAEMLVEAGTVTPEIADLVSFGRRAGVPVREVARGGLDGLGAGSHRGLLARLRPYAYAELSTVVESAADLVLALDCVQDPRNLGAILRTGEAAGAGAVILPRDRSAPVTASVVRGAAGHAYRVPVVQVTNLVRALEQLKDLGWWVLGLSPRGETSLYDIALPRRIVLVGGGEERGIRPLVRRSCDHLVSLPMAASVDSLNASVALGVALYEIRRRRGPAGGAGEASAGGRVAEAIGGAACPEGATTPRGSDRR